MLLTVMFISGGHVVVRMLEPLGYKPIPEGVIGVFHCHNPSDWIRLPL
jgi:hypothetical protein